PQRDQYVEDAGVEAIYDLLTAEPPGWDGAQDQGRGGSRRSSKTSVGRKVLSGRAACGLGFDAATSEPRRQRNSASAGSRSREVASERGSKNLCSCFRSSLGNAGRGVPTALPGAHQLEQLGPRCRSPNQPPWPRSWARSRVPFGNTRVANRCVGASRADAQESCKSPAHQRLLKPFRNEPVNSGS